jgi:hypothetical protein
MLKKLAAAGLATLIAFAPMVATARSSAKASAHASQPFDRGAVGAALGAVNVSSCKKANGPTGSGHVTVTFSPGGGVSNALIDSPPFEGSNISGCLAGKFRGVHIPAFAGSPIKVGKSFTLN